MRTPKIKNEHSDVKPFKVIHPNRVRRIMSLPIMCFVAIAITLFFVARYKYERLLASLDVKTSELSKSAIALAESKTELSTVANSRKTILTQFDSVKLLHFNRLIQFADFVWDDPVLAKRILDEAAEFADANKLDLTPIRNRMAALPKTKILATGTKLSVLSMNHTASVSTVELIVQESNNAPVDELARVDFTITHKGKPIHLVRVEPIMVASENHRVSLWFDCSTSFASGMPDAKHVGKALVTELANPWKFRIGRFSSDVQIISPWSIDPEIHNAAIDSLVADGATSLLAAMEVDAKEHAKFDGTQSTVIVTDGKDSHGTANIEAILKLYQQSATRVHVLALDRGDIDEPLLRRIAAETEGSFQKLSSSQELRAGFKAIAERMKRPAYRLTILGPIDRESLSIQLANDSLTTPTAKPQLTSASNSR